MKVRNVRGAGGIRLHVRELGNPTGMPIFLFHGWPQNLLCWTKQCESELQHEFRITAVDLRGHGMADSLRPH